MTKDNLPHQSPHRFELAAADPEALSDPRWLRRRGPREVARVGESGAILLDGVLLVFDVAKGSFHQPPRTEVLVSFGIPRIYCELVTEVQTYKESLQHQNDEAAAKVRVSLNQMRDDAVVFNGKIKLPVPWTTGIKMVLSGLSERSNGDGTSKRTVHHIMLQSDLVRGALKRKKGDFLCTADRGKVGTHWDGSPDLRLDGDGKLYCAKVTCATCLRRASFIMGRPIE